MFLFQIINKNINKFIDKIVINNNHKDKQRYKANNFKHLKNNKGLNNYIIRFNLLKE